MVILLCLLLFCLPSSLLLLPGYQWDMCSIVLSLLAQHCMAIYLPTSCAQPAVLAIVLSPPDPHSPHYLPLTGATCQSQSSLTWGRWLLPCHSQSPRDWTVFFSPEQHAPQGMLFTGGKVTYCSMLQKEQICMGSSDRYLRIYGWYCNSGIVILLLGTCCFLLYISKIFTCFSHTKVMFYISNS